MDEFLKSGLKGQCGDDDELEDEEEYSSPLDDVDEVVAFTAAIQAATTQDGHLLGKAGLQPMADAPSQLEASESEALRTVIADGVARQQKGPQDAAGRSPGA